jgi:adenosylhomocysteine nucleosidase
VVHEQINRVREYGLNMRLHGMISPDLPLLVVALEEEASHLHTHGLPILVTGAGKVNAAVATATILGSHSPSQVVNLGTAGALVDDLTGIHVIGTVTQHDLNDQALFNLTGLHFGAPITLQDSGLVLTTGDQFIADESTRRQLAEHAHLVDMEGYAIAKAAMAAQVPVMLVKQVSDSADSSASRSWRDTVDYCAEQLGAWTMNHLSR